MEKQTPLTKAETETVKAASKALLDSLGQLLTPLDRWTEKEQTQAIVKVHVLDELFNLLPSPPYSDDDKEESAQRVYDHLWQTNAGGPDSQRAA